MKNTNPTSKSKDSHGSTGQKWTAFDLDGTLAQYSGWQGPQHIGSPIPSMCNLIKSLHRKGTPVKILTARVAPNPQNPTSPTLARQAIEQWCSKYLGFIPQITHQKDSLMDALYDDRAVQVIPNTGVPIEQAAKDLLNNQTQTSNTKALRDYLNS